ncbi:LacI family DNA-binding transcriptional regulator [Geminisphaera colitermitum]|uniref:LacI family DNA-binding transcriptional regulator n=1 Tax=Geminisphaera colitermitum TaxID=1148786 RepID=UPI000158D06B|nr:LacI family DNA-binding transcriptional regulator [Geminisphaera colitermitum]
MPPPDTPITLQTIADRAGVTRALVSMALRDSPKVAAATRERLQRMARELGYRPNPMVRALMTSLRARREATCSAALGFITAFRTRDHWKTLRTYPEYFEGAAKRGMELGYRLEHFWLGDYASHPSRLEQVLLARGIRGVLVPPLSQDRTVTWAQVLNNMSFKDFSVVAFGYSLAKPNLPRVCNYHIQTVETAMRQLSQRGYRRIGAVISENETRQVNMLWSAGLEVARRQMPELKIMEFSKQAEGGWSEKAFRAWLVRRKPEVIVGLTEVWNWVRNLDKRMPDELGFLHLDRPRDAIFSGMYQNTTKLGIAAVEWLANLVEGNVQCEKAEPRVLLIASDFVEGATLRKIPNEE